MTLLNVITDKTIWLSAAAYTVGLMDIDMIVKILIGIVTIIYVGYKALNEKKKYDEK